MARKQTISTRASSKNVINIHVGDVGKKRGKRRAPRQKKSVDEGQFINLMRGMAERPIAPSMSTTSIRLEAPNLGRMVSVPAPLIPDSYGSVPAVVNPVGVARPSNGSGADLQPNPRPNVHEAANPNDVQPRNPSILLMPASPSPSPSPVGKGGPTYASMASSSSSPSSSSLSSRPPLRDPAARMRAVQEYKQAASSSRGPTNDQLAALLTTAGISVPGGRNKAQLMDMVRQNAKRIFEPEDPEYDQ